MGFDDICNTGLVLGLGFSSSTAEKNHHRKPKGVITYEPSLTLSLSGETYKKIDESAVGVCILDHQSNDHDNLLCRQDSAASSFSNVSVKRERDHHILLSSEDVETTMDRVVSRVISTTTDDDEDGTNARKKLRLTKAQSAFLEESFKLHSTLNPKQKQDLAKELKLRPRQVEVWFQNRRARTKLKQTEVDCEFLKKCCETLTDENRRLQKELQELKSLKLAQPFYMQLPAATLTMCPSCERIGGVNENAATSKKPPQLFNNPFANQSAAC